jgi:hypothetical protein
LWGGIKRRMGRREEEECFLFPFEEMTYHGIVFSNFLHQSKKEALRLRLWKGL